ncbi:hypothetical protein Mal15_46920 [Stieleria maiorica]|uniref:Uncharacterized protein n=1 Tax=Stieleria maiorica TaxID=2795974 RepID=A0A5B9MKS4_9BACT|nr:hypothetical protein [Stieleria maiorica]QEG00621.1 hypothetical protein Mal15_46920 [Stieleria maiorica]
MPHSTQQKVIEFMGGPLDGHREPLAVTVEQLPKQIVCYISANVFRQLDGRQNEYESSVTSLVIYQRENQQQTWNYAFAGSFAPHERSSESSDRHRTTRQNDKSA